MGHLESKLGYFFECESLLINTQANGKLGSLIKYHIVANFFSNSLIIGGCADKLHPYHVVTLVTSVSPSTKLQYGMFDCMLLTICVNFMSFVLMLLMHSSHTYVQLLHKSLIKLSWWLILFVELSMMCEREASVALGVMLCC